MKSSGPHIFTILVSIAIVGLIVKIILQAKGHKVSTSKVRAIYLTCFLSGVLFANAIPHFIHGISGEPFPAPFGYLLDSNFAKNLSNVIWGFINIVLGYNLLIVGKVFKGDKKRQVIFLAGFLAMAIFLSFVFSHSSHSFLKSV